MMSIIFAIDILNRVTWHERIVSDIPYPTALHTQRNRKPRWDANWSTKMFLIQVYKNVLLFHIIMLFKFTNHSRVDSGVSFMGVVKRDMGNLSSS